MRRNPQTIWCAILVAACLLAPNARAAGNRVCDPRHPTVDFPLLADLPPAVRMALAKRDPMAEKGEKFNATDVISLNDPTPRRRFVRAGQWGNFVLVWYEAGGIALFHRVALFRLDDAGAAKELSDQNDSGQDACALMNSP